MEYPSTSATLAKAGSEARGPSLMLVGSTAKSDAEAVNVGEENAPTLVSVSTIDGRDENAESRTETEDQGNPSGSNVDGVQEQRPRLSTTLLIFKRPSDSSDGYVVANPTPAEDWQDESESGRRHKKKKKHKSKERVVAMKRSNAVKLLEIQKFQSISSLSSTLRSRGEDETERRRSHLTQSSPACDTDNPVTLRSPPPSTPLLGKPASFHGYKHRVPLSRKRQMSTGSSFDLSNNRRRYPRKRRYEVEDSKLNSLTPSGEEVKKSHLSENNVWTPVDDFRLLLNIQQTKGNLEQVYIGTKFSCFYTFEQVGRRWETLLYDDKAGSLAQTAINNLHPQVKVRIQSEAVYSDEEEDLLRTIKMVPGGNPEFSCFTKLLEENPHTLQYRTPKRLFLHWLEMRNFHLLDGQNVQDYKEPFNLYDLQDNTSLTALSDAVLSELQTESKQVKRQIRMLEEELESWNCMQELVVSDGTADLHSIFSVSEFDDQTFAILRGKQVRYCMRSKEILLGRNSTNNKVDADLTLEGASGKVSRRQAIIQMHAFGEFYIINQGRHSIFVDNIHVSFGGMAKLTDGCVIQITHIKLIFKVNEKLIRKEITHEIKKEVLNARLKSYDTFTPSFTATNKSPILTDVFPSTSRYANSPKKKGSTHCSPVLGSNGSLTSLKANGLRPSTHGSTGGSTQFPFINDLTIRPSSHLPPSSMFFTDPSKSQYSRTAVPSTSKSDSDNDVFKKPAPVPVTRLQPSKTSAAKRTPSPPVAVSQSAFVSVGPIPPTTTNGTPCGGVDSSMKMSFPQPSSTPINTLDYSKLGLPSDLTVRQTTSDPGNVLPNETSSTNSVGDTNTLVSVDPQNIAIPTPTLRLVKVDSPSPPTPTTQSS